MAGGFIAAKGLRAYIPNPIYLLEAADLLQ